jgi:hypothetical protein
VSRVHDAMRRIEQTHPPAPAGGALSKLVSALIEELASDVSDDPRLETVRSDLVTASRSFHADRSILIKEDGRSTASGTLRHWLLLSHAADWKAYDGLESNVGDFSAHRDLIR